MEEALLSRVSPRGRRGVDMWVSQGVSCTGQIREAVDNVQIVVKGEKRREAEGEEASKRTDETPAELVESSDGLTG